MLNQVGREGEPVEATVRHEAVQSSLCKPAMIATRVYRKDEDPVFGSVVDQSSRTNPVLNIVSNDNNSVTIVTASEDDSTPAQVEIQT